MILQDCNFIATPVRKTRRKRIARIFVKNSKTTRMHVRLTRLVLLLFSISFLAVQSVSAQKFFYKPKIKIKPEKWYVGMQTGMLIFQGDLKQKDYFPVNQEVNEWGLGYMIYGRHNFSDNFNMQFRYLRGNLAGMESAKNRYFKAKVNEYSLQCHFNLNRLISKKLDPEFIYIYAYAGIGISSFRSVKRSILGDTVISTQGYITPGLSKKKATREAVFPAGFGFQFNLNRIVKHKKGYTSNYYADVMFNLSNVNTDKLDVEVDPFQSGKDKYWSITVGLTYRFGKPFRSLNYSTGIQNRGRGDLSTREPLSEEEILQQELLIEEAVQQQMQFNKAISTVSAEYKDVAAPSPYTVLFNPNMEKLDDVQKEKAARWSPLIRANGRSSVVAAYLSIYNNDEMHFQKTRARLYHLYSLLTADPEMSPDLIDLVIYIYTEEKASFLPLKNNLANRCDLRIN